VAPADEPKHLLGEVRFLDALEPGVYALHWGALNGYSATDSRLFLFAVPSPEPPPQEASPPVEEKQEKPKARKGAKAE
jgi:hypothetical protein